MRLAESIQRTAAALAVAAVAAVGIAACDDDDETTTVGTTGPTGTTGAAGGGGETLAVSLTEYALDPQDPTVSPGTVTIEATNDGAIAHNIAVEGPADEVELAADLQAGDSGTLEVDLSEPGTYRWYCPVGNHAEQGMEGEITVE